jgi:hypothetical protein
MANLNIASNPNPNPLLSVSSVGGMKSGQLVMANGSGGFSTTDGLETTYLTLKQGDEELILSFDDLKNIKELLDFINNSSLKEEYEEFKLFKRLKE